MTEDVDPAALKAMLVGLRKMKSNLMKRRLDEDATPGKRIAAPARLR